MSLIQSHQGPAVPLIENTSFVDVRMKGTFPVGGRSVPQNTAVMTLMAAIKESKKRFEIMFQTVTHKDRQLFNVVEVRIEKLINLAKEEHSAVLLTANCRFLAKTRV